MLKRLGKVTLSLIVVISFIGCSENNIDKVKQSTLKISKLSTSTYADLEKKMSNTKWTEEDSTDSGFTVNTVRFSGEIVSPKNGSTAKIIITIVNAKSDTKTFQNINYRFEDKKGGTLIYSIAPLGTSCTEDGKSKSIERCENQFYQIFNYILNK